tara:strand:+ start:898 stop:1077 length:180 start_codon:yes stop_codon:yes gene_type:complete
VEGNVFFDENPIDPKIHNRQVRDTGHSDNVDVDVNVDSFLFEFYLTKYKLVIEEFFRRR